MERGSALVLGLGVVGIAGFVGGLAALSWGALSPFGALALAAASLTLLMAALIVGTLGDPLELRRRTDEAHERRARVRALTAPSRRGFQRPAVL